MNAQKYPHHPYTWWRHQMEPFSALLVLCAGKSPVSGEFPSQRPVTRSFGVFFYLRVNKRLSKQSWGWWFETLSRSLWRHRNDASYGASFLGSLEKRYRDITNVHVPVGHTSARRPVLHVYGALFLTHLQSSHQCISIAGPNKGPSPS